MLHVYLCSAEKCNSFTIWIRFQTIMCVWNNSHSLFLPFNEKLFALMSRRTAKKGNKSLNKNVLDISNTLSAEFFSQFMVECVAFHQAEFLKIKGKYFPLSSFIRRYMWDLRDISVRDFFHSSRTPSLLWLHGNHKGFKTTFQEWIIEK